MMGGAQDAGTVSVRVQVIDVESAALDLVVPTYLPAKDVTQRIARDANLGAYWPDGSRRQFWIRARGRLLGPDERLQDLGVLNGELIHILPQPPEGSGVIERTPEYPRNRGYRGGNMVVMIGSFLWMLAFAMLWGVGLTVPLGVVGSVFACSVPAIALALMCVTTARHLFGPPGSHFRIPAVGLVLFVPVFTVGVLPGFFLGAEATALGIGAGVGFVAGVFGVVMGWLSWFGAVEPLPEISKIEQKEAARVQAQVAQCAICGQNIDLTNAEARQDCVYGCGRVFHAGCYRARAAIAREGQCAVCGYTPGAA